MTPGEEPLAARLATVDRIAEDLHLAARSSELDRHPAFPRAEFRALAAAGLVGLRIPRAWGGHGLSLPEAGRVLARLAYRGGTTFAKLALQPEFCWTLASLGSESQRHRYFDPLLRGELLIGNHITEPDAGSDVGGLRASAVPTAEGYRIAGTKSEAAFAVDAELAIVYARVPGPAGSPGLTAFLVRQDLPGVRREVVPDLGERWMRRGTVRYEGVQVEAEARLGAEGTALDALKDELSRERALLAAIYLGVGRASWEATMAHVGERAAFGSPLSERQGVAFPLVQDGVRLRSAELYAGEVLERLERGDPDAAADAGLAKWWATETALSAIDHAIQFHGGRGYSQALPHEQRWRDVRSGALAHGPSEVLLANAARARWPRRRA